MKELKWKDFKIKDLKPNLIDSGWDSFKTVGDTDNFIKGGFDSFSPYGVGINYIDNWDYRESKLDVGNDWKTRFDISLKKGESVVVRARGLLKEGNAPLRVLLEGDGISQNIFLNYSSDSSVQESTFIADGDFDYVILRTNVPNSVIQLDWLQLTPTNNQHLVLEKVRLNNHFTRIQTWGGNNVRKLIWSGGSYQVGSSLSFSQYIYTSKDMTINFSHDKLTIDNIHKQYVHKIINIKNEAIIQCRYETKSIPGNLDFIVSDPIINEGDKPNLTLLKEKLDNGLTHIRAYGGQESGKLRFIANSEKVGDPLNLSMYINNRGSDISLHHDAPSTNDTIKSGHNGFFENITEVSIGNYKYVGIGTKGHLDFIASDPQLVESTKHNPVLIVDELEDGREHVQVHGAYVDTKLISKEVQGFSGEPYQIKTDIDNEGLELSMSSTLGDKSIDINKGSNSISHTGELKGNRIIVELGAKNG